jgi:hypothetical protein
MDMVANAMAANVLLGNAFMMFPFDQIIAAVAVAGMAKGWGARLKRILRTCSVAFWQGRGHENRPPPLLRLLVVATPGLHPFWLEHTCQKATERVLSVCW